MGKVHEPFIDWVRVKIDIVNDVGALVAPVGDDGRALDVLLDPSPELFIVSGLALDFFIGEFLNNFTGECISHDAFSGGLINAARAQIKK